jgi:hypothetical protein
MADLLADYGSDSGSESEPDAVVAPDAARRALSALVQRPAAVADDAEEDDALAALRRIRKVKKEKEVTLPAVVAPASEEAAAEPSEEVREEAHLPTVVSAVVAPAEESTGRGRAKLSRQFERLGKRARADEGSGAPAPKRTRDLETLAKRVGVDVSLLSSMGEGELRDLAAFSGDAPVVGEVNAAERTEAWLSNPASAVPLTVLGPTRLSMKRWDAASGTTVTGAATSHEKHKNQITVVAQRAMSHRLHQAHTQPVGMGGGVSKVQPRQKYGW